FALTAASVPGIEVACTEAPDLRSAVPSWATAARDRAGDLELITLAPFSSSSPFPLANSPAVPAQTWKLRAASELLVSAPRGSRSPSSSPLALGPEVLCTSALPLASEPTNEARACTLPTTAGRVAPASGTPSPSQESPGSSPKACAPSAEEANSPPCAPGV